jgi:hypothetical protein
MFCDYDEQLSWIFGCAFAFLERRRRNDFLDRRLDVCCYRRLWFWCCLLLLLEQIIGLATVIFCWRRSVRSLTKWSSSDPELLCVCSTLKCSMFDGGWTILLNCCSQHFPFYCWDWKRFRIFFLWRFQYSYFVVLGVSERRVKIPWECLVCVSTLVLQGYEFVLWNDYWLSTTG